MTFCECGCGLRAPIARQTLTARGWIKGQPLRFVQGHNVRKPVKYEVVDTGYRTPCWLWLLRCDAEGYGRITVNGKHGQLAHRVFFERAFGPIQAGLEPDHLCRQRRCVNPDHLELVTRAENTRRGLSAKLTVDDVEGIRSSRECSRVLAARFGVTQGHISDIRRRRTWVAT